jgi:predicted dehydrogenase
VPRVLGVGLLGYGSVARAHATGVRVHAEAFPEAPATGRVVALAGRTSGPLAAAAQRFGIPRCSTEWQSLVDDPAVEVLVNAGPNEIHAAPCVAALQAGKAVLCEKPLARTAGEAETMARAAATAGTVAMTGFNYRFVPAVLLARRLISEGRIGRIYHFRGRYSDDSLLDPASPHTWHHDRTAAGSGVIGDLASHVIDLAHFLVGPVAAVSAAARTFIRARSSAGGQKRAVTVEDAVVATLEFENGAIGTLEASGMCPGRKNLLTFEVNGADGTLAFDLERLNELRVFHGDGEARGLADVLVTERDHPYGGHWWPPGHILGWEHAFAHQFDEVVRRVTHAGGTLAGATFADGLIAARVCDALIAAAETGRRVSIGRDARGTRTSLA